MQFRSDIQGLRGLAVLGVLLFHLRVAAFSGGYIGVDVFFVISGFLITSIIADDLARGRFSFADFYNRRLKRILPVFHLVGFVTLAAGWFLLLPSSLLTLIKSLVASSLFGSNIYFWRETTGYFGSEADELPLLHNWSLSVEEQYYLIWPMMLLLLLRFANRTVVLLVSAACMLLAFGVAEWGAGFKATAAYFLLPTRLGEFLLGAALVFVPVARTNLRPVSVQLVAAAGLILILAPFFLLDATSRFPGLNAFWPCLGTAMVIDSGRRMSTAVKSLLSVGPLVYVGTISYSVYLWHWPPIAFLHYFDVELSDLQKFILFSGVLAVAGLSWRFVEQTVRKVPWQLPQTVLTLVALPILVSVGALAIAGSRKPAFPGLAEEISSPDYCRELNGASYPEPCRLGDKASEPTFVLWGDSFADTLSAAIDQSAKRDHASGYRFIFHMCPSIAGTLWDDVNRIPSVDFPRQCSDFGSRTLKFVLANQAISTVILTSSYTWYLDAKNAAGHPILVAAHSGTSVAEAFKAMLLQLAAARKRVVVVMPHPGDKDIFNSTLRRAFVTGTTHSLNLPGRHMDSITAMIESLPAHVQIEKIYPHSMMCDIAKCRMFDESGGLYLSDGAHVTGKTARAIVEQFPQGWDLATD
jgi:peptidoglycan/LPS O-acetylase OafA/YrhL